MRKESSIKNGFTLIELLVVVLIIGVLAAIALPQYQKAVAKSRGAELITMVKSLDTAQQAYFLATGRWANNFDLLDVDFKSLNRLTEEQAHSYDVDDAYMKGETVFVAVNSSGLSMGFLGTGPYAMSGFGMWAYPEINPTQHDRTGFERNQLYCMEFEATPTGFCEKLQRGTYARTRDGIKYYKVN